MTEPTKEEIEDLEEAVHYQAAPILYALLDAYEERGREIERLRAEGIILPSESSVARMLDHWKGRAEQAKTRLGEVVEALERYRDIPDGVDGSWTAANTLASLAASQPEEKP